MRGYDQAALIASAFAARRRLTYRPILIRMTAQRQVGASAQERRAQTQNAFRLGCKPPAQKLLLIDDVMTTGSTLQSAAAAITHAYPQAVDIRAAVFAYA